MKETPDFSQYQEYRAKGEINNDTLHDPVNNASYSRYSMTNLHPMYQNDRMFSSRIVEPEVNQDKFIFHMRNLLHDFYTDIIDPPNNLEFEKPETSYQLLQRSQIRGTKDSNEYRNKKLKKAEKTLRAYKDQYNNPGRYFEENPPLVCEIPGENEESTFALLRGHHELRKAGKYKIEDIACEVISIDELASSLNAYEPSKYIGKVTTDKLMQFLTSQMQISQSSFKTARALDRPISKPQY